MWQNLALHDYNKEHLSKEAAKPQVTTFNFKTETFILVNYCFGHCLRRQHC